MNYLYDYTLQQLQELITPKFRAKQIYHWLYHRYADKFELMTDISKTQREELARHYALNQCSIIKKERSSDGSIKYLFKTHDDHTFESVLLKMKDTMYHEDQAVAREAQYTLCLSTQIGCKVGCSFCLTAKGGFVRNLTPGEIVYQIVAIKKDQDFAAEKRLNLVYMGMGEPLDNFDNVKQAIQIIADLNGLAISPKRQTISTSGISTKIDRLGQEDLGVMLAISLHAVDDATRDQLIPMNRAYNIESIIAAVKRFPIDSRKRVMFEYLVIKNVNDSLESADKLIKLLSGIKAKVNLIYFNPYPGSPYERPDESRMKALQEKMVAKGLFCTIRESKGLDISAACGQLREKENA